MKTKYFPQGGEKIEYIHYLNKTIKVLLSSEGVPIGIDPLISTENGRKIYRITTTENIKNKELKMFIERKFGD